MVGYLLAGVVVGPFTHTVVGERELAREMLRKARIATEPTDAPPTTS